MSGKKPTDDNSREEMELTDLTSVSCKLTDENKERLAKEKNKDIQLGGVVEEPCTFSEERSLEDGSHITPVDITQEHPVINTANEEAHALEVERKLDEALREGDFDLLQERITPKTLTSCKTNALFKTFEVNKTLKGLVEKAVNPETDEIQTLSNSLNEFTYAFVDPLRSDSDTRHTFKSCLDFMIDKAIDEGQKKFVSHPVVYNLLNSRWYRSFNVVRKQPWTSLRRWGYMLLSFWTVIDIVVFPFLFAFFYILHFIYLWLRKLRDTDICFVVTLTSDASDEAFGLIKRTIGFLIQKYGLYSAKYCVILRDFNNVSTSKISFEEGYSSETELLNRVEAMQKLISPSWLYKDLSAALAAFKSSSVRKDSKKLLIVFTNGKIRMSRDDGTEDLHPIVDELKEIGARIISVGIGADTTLSEMKKIASKNKTALHFGEYEAPKTLGKAIIHGEEGKDIFDRYLYYFTTPYFVFLRDSLSYLALLGLHFDICLSPSTLAFTKLEWVIFLFFIGRIVIEIDQFMSVKKSRRKEPLEGHWTPGKESRQRLYRGSSYEVCASPDDVQVVMTAEENVTRKRLINYFSDRWNMLDFIILIIYLAIFFLRMISWATSSTVYDNRALAVAGYLYGFVAMFLTLRVFGHVMESIRGMGAKLIAFFSIMWDVFAIFWQFAAMILAFSLAMTKIYVVETSYTSNGTSVEDLACSEGGLTCWWTMAQHLSWSCLGISGLEQLDSVDRPSVSLSYLLYGLFLVMVVVLLVNMMIALLSNTYNRVEENSLREWSFKKATTIRSYSSYHPVPVPFNIVSLEAIGLWRLCQGDKGNRFDKSGFDEKGRKAALDRLVERLEKTYFATFGYTFPLTEAKKVDHLLHEIDGSRRMANQIAQRVFAQQGCKQDRYIAGAEAWESLGIGIKGCLLTYEGPDSCHSCKEKEPKSVHGARCLTPFTREKPRIEVLIQESGERRILGLGVVFEGYDSHWMPGWEAGTVGYHVDDGKIFEAGFEDFGRDVEEAMAYRGDLIACEVDFSGVRNGKLPVVFFLNGREIARAWTKRISEEIKVFPFISMAYEGIRVLAKMCPGDSSMSQISHAPSAQRLARDVGIEKELTDCLQKQFLELKDDMETMERERKVQATEFQERLDKQWQLLTEIRNLVMLSNREGKRKELDEN